MCLKKEFQILLEKYWFDGWAQDDRCWRMALAADGLYVLHSNLVRHRLHGSNTATYGKYHTLSKRIRLFEDMRQASQKMMQYMDDQNTKDPFYKMLQRNEKMFERRIDLIGKRKFLNCFPLLGDLPYYQAGKSYLVEILLALKGK